jgi:UDP-N-acetyl-D-galactosamine dehydrogenase
VVQLLIQNGKHPGESKVLVLGITFKENVADIRNSKVAELVQELKAFSVKVEVSDPQADYHQVIHEYGIALIQDIANDYDAVIVAVAHDAYKQYDKNYFSSITKEKPVIIDLKALYNRKELEDGMTYWRL